MRKFKADEVEQVLRRKRFIERMERKLEFKQSLHDLQEHGGWALETKR